MFLQRTIRDVVEFSGVSLHTGEYVRLCIKPAAEDTGIVFVRTDIESKPKIKAVWTNIVETELSTVIANGDGIRVATVEHLLSALRGLQIDNVVVEVSAPELPILDGSSSLYVDALNKVGYSTQGKARKYLQVIKPVSVSIGDRFLYFLPATRFKITCRVNYKRPIGLQHLEYRSNPTLYSTEISRAKTFGFLDEARELQKSGLIRGGSYDNALVLNSKGVVNKESMSYENEFVRHKILDIIGDLALVGSRYLIAHVVAYKTGHTLHASALNELAKHRSYCRVVEKPIAVDEKVFAKKVFSLLAPIPSL